ncbi:MAG: 50S ribosomal protein L9 [Chloroflexi bacterium]|nr:50S ribosomal protein L9 [Chloroflexota bacterium]MDA1241080.1 50S ribosomal protein L9 [Chloroflexota bacterium]
MKVVFLETVEGSGTMGEVRDVAPGYARNYLLPRGLAAPATPQVLARADRLRALEEERQRAEDERARGLVGKLESNPLIIAVRVGEQGRLYGSVTNADIAQKAGEILGEELDRRRVLLPEAIRRVGVYPVGLRLSRNVQPQISVVVVDADAPEGAEAAAAALLASLAEEEQAQAAAVAAKAAAQVAVGEPESGTQEDESEEQA